MGWGANLVGYGATLDVFEELGEQWGGDAAAVVGTNVEYSPFVEFGTANMAAQPYLRPSVESATRKMDAIASRADNTEELVKLLALDVERGGKQRVPVDTGNLKGSIRAEML